jgi:inhibitor of KinA sporulation pathway (predicted exonuclease)
MPTGIIFDLEWNSWKGNYILNNNLIERRKKWQSKDILQLGAIKFNIENFEIIGSFNIYIKPKNIFLHNYIIRLTNIDSCTLRKKGHYFFRANNMFKKFINNSKILICNGDDYLIYQENIKKNFLNEFFFKKKKIINIRNFLKKKFQLNETGVSSPNLILNNNLSSHNSLDDAKKIYYFLKKKKIYIGNFF